MMDISPHKFQLVTGYYALDLCNVCWIIKQLCTRERSQMNARNEKYRKPMYLSSVGNIM